MTDNQKAYQEYLSSDKWKTIRAQRLDLDRGECVLCGEPAKHVHHRRYPKVWGTETISDLVSLCGGCHSKHHDNSPKEVDWSKPTALPEDIYSMGEVVHQALNESFDAAEMDSAIRIASAIRTIVSSCNMYLDCSAEETNKKCRSIEETIGALAARVGLLEKSIRGK